MPRGYIGESKSDKAMNKMIKHLEKSDRQSAKAPRRKEDDSLLAQLKETYGSRWREELAEMELEHKSPRYLADKKSAREALVAEFARIPRGEKLRNGMVQEDYVTKKLDLWILENRKRYC